MTDLETRPESSTEPQTTVVLTVDAELLQEALRQTGSDSIDATVGEALRRLVEEERGKRRRALDNLRRMAAEGLIDFDAIERNRG